MVRRLVTSSVTSRDYDAIVMTSQSSQSSHSETRTRINYPCGSFKHIVEHCVYKKGANFT